MELSRNTTRRQGCRAHTPAAVEETRGRRYLGPPLRRVLRGGAPRDPRSLNGETPPAAWGASFTAPLRSPPHPSGPTAPAPACRARRGGQSGRSPSRGSSRRYESSAPLRSAPLGRMRPLTPAPGSAPSLRPRGERGAARRPREASSRESLPGGRCQFSREWGGAPRAGHAGEGAGPRAIGGARPPPPPPAPRMRRAPPGRVPGACVCVCHPRAAQRPRERSRLLATRDRAPGTHRAG